jgi:uncharacterized protein (DUF736 family)
MNDKVKIGGVWKSTAKDGREYYSGKVNDNFKLLVFPNNNKKNDREPDLHVYLAPIDRNAGGANDATATAAPETDSGE